ncbi:NAD(P)/FAD-dependent oxidoreductase [Candidatus Parcubacteria bacterium]|nr:NAD(P)/FAD-dependent oxidoreductase [Candidatus Parcubacteria bacterium]
MYDVVVIGGGPTGMMAAGRAGELGARVLLLEKNGNLGRKLLICGKGRCNITNYTTDVHEMVVNYGKNGKFLFSSLHKFGVIEIIDFFESRGVKIKIERGNRVFPLSDLSSDILDVMLDYLKQSKVKIRTGIEVKRIIKKGNLIEKIILDNGEEVMSKNFVITTGGKSYPATGSTGIGYGWLKMLGHKIKTPKPALTPMIVKEDFIKNLEGLSLKNVEVSIFKNDKKIESQFGEALFTGNGLSGPVIIDMSKKVGELTPGDIKIKIDFKPALDFKKLDLRILNDFKEMNNKLFKNSLDKLLPQKLIPIIIKLSGIDSEKKVNLVTHQERKKLIHLLKEFTLSFKSLVGFNKAIITTGGVDLSEVDPKTCQSKIIDNLYLAGEILDIDGPTGGYNLQICWSTGFAVGNSIY